MKKLYIICICQVISIMAQAQQITSSFEFGVLSANRPYEVYSFNFGRTFNDQLYVSTGVSLYNYVIISKGTVKDQPDRYEHTTNSVLSVVMNINAQYNIPIYTFSDGSKFDQFGFAPEIQFHIAPWMPHSFSYLNSKDELIRVDGENYTQFPYTLGIGLFLSSNPVDLLIKFKTTNIDQFKTLRALRMPDNDIVFSKPNFFIFSFSFIYRK